MHMVHHKDIGMVNDVVDKYSMDQILVNCLKLVIRRYKDYENNIFGLVGAALVTAEHETMYETSRATLSQKYKHAEYCVIEKFINKYGSIPSDAILVTTLSPCFNHMDDRYGDSCSNIISAMGIKIVYSGLSDTTQLKYDPAHYDHVPYDLIITQNEDIKELCSLLLNKIDSFQQISD